MVAAHSYRPMARSRARTVTPLLRYLARDFADAVSNVWRPPFGGFFTLPSARRHVAAIALSGLSRTFFSDVDLRRDLEFERDSALARKVVGDTAPGFMKALAKSGERLWSRADYEAFLHLFAEPMANGVLRHSSEVEPAVFMPLTKLPPQLRLANVVKVVDTVEVARDLGMAFRLAVSMRRPGCEARLAARWSSGGDKRAVFERAVADLTPDDFRAPSPAPRLPVPFQMVAKRSKLEIVAREFHNCLADYSSRIAEGRMAVYVWRVASPVAVALNWDVAGWRLSEAKGVSNEDVDEASLRELVATLAAHGVRTGPSVETISQRLHNRMYDGSNTHRCSDDFVSRLELGDLWS